MQTRGHDSNKLSMKNFIKKNDSISITILYLLSNFKQCRVRVGINCYDNNNTGWKYPRRMKS